MRCSRTRARSGSTASAVHFRSPRDARRAGIETVYQDLAVAPALDIASNIFLGRELRRRGPLGRVLRMLDKRAMRREATRHFAELQIGIQSMAQPVENLSGGQRQGVAVARAATWARRVVIMDEPTAALGVKETRQVLDLIKRVRDRGLPVILISHDMPNVFELADRIQIMRLGRRVAVVTPQTPLDAGGRGDHDRARTASGIRSTNRRTDMSYEPAADRYDRMLYRRCGRSGLLLPAVSLGLWWNFGHDRPLETSRAIVRRAFDLGVTHFDLANNYGPPYGSAEENFGRLLRRRPAAVPRRARHLDEGRLRHVAGPVRRVGLAQVPPREPRPEPARAWASTTSTSSTRTASTPTRRSRRRWARSTPRCARARRSTPASPPTRAERTREAAAILRELGHAAPDPPAVVLDAEPLDRAGAARHARASSASAASASRRSPRGC